MDRTLTVSDIAQGKDEAAASKLIPSELCGFRVWKLPPTTPDDFIPQELEGRVRLEIADTKAFSHHVYSNEEEPLALLIEASSPLGWRYLFPIESQDDLESFEDNLEDLRREIESD